MIDEEVASVIVTEGTVLLMVNTCSALHANIQDAFNEAGVEILSPHFAQLRDGNRTAIPDAYLPADYVPGSIRVEEVKGKGPGG